ncbi:nucleotidyltransferase domain-containing protein [Paenibacillus sp. FSL H8-0537]|uniref:nucleotidyltransferase domain-containing protein n=1 Tax=Paenibacillus sp. FSL H8-0537 TaxID=2921399 RepID=UPI0031011B72
MMDVADTLVKHIKSHFAKDVAIIAYYGSYAQGTATKRSDLDFFFIPTTPEGYKAMIQFVIDQISFDFWPISWERAAKMAAYQEPNTSIIADCKILYARSEEDLAQFEQLRASIAAAPQTDGLAFTEKAEEELRKSYMHLYAMVRREAGELATFRQEASGVLTHCLSSLTLLNRTYLKKVWGKSTEQILSFSIQPAGLKQQINTILRSTSCEELRQTCEQLVDDIHQLINDEKAAFDAGCSYPDRLKGFYEEIKGSFDKLRTACEQNDYETAFFWSIWVQDLTAQLLYFGEKGYWSANLASERNHQQLYLSMGFPDLVQALDPQNLALLLSAVESLDLLLESHLREQGVAIRHFQTLEQFEAFLQQSLK